MRIAPIVLLGALLAARPAAAGDDADVVVRKWLVLAPVDVNARRPLRPDAVFARYLLDRASAPPKEGEEVVGTLGKSAKWTARAAETDPKNDGVVEATAVGWAYASVESATDRVAIAKLESASFLVVNGAGFTGDVYGLGDVGVPVALRKGANDVFVAGPRGGFRLSFRRPETQANDSSKAASGAFVVDKSRNVAPDFTEGETDFLPSSTRVFNATTSAATLGDETVVPLGVKTIRAAAPAALRRVAKPGEPYRRTFVSSIDGAVQSYAVVPPAPSGFDKSKIGLVLSLHGADVECMSQARAYVPKPDFWIVCPTNRGRFGFDWQDWGRLDAYEVLADALKVTGVDPRRVYLTGHSMGGHGTWHLAANDPGRFLAIAPSAGWSGFDSYGAPKVPSRLGDVWRAADGASRTMDLISNLAPIPTYVLHGDADDNVPASEAHKMIDALTAAGGKPLFHFEPKAGHWWDDPKTPGAECVDWPGIWELFRKTQPTRAPQNGAITVLDFWRPAQFGWVRFERPIDFGRPSRLTVKSSVPRGTGSVTTENVGDVVILDPYGDDQSMGISVEFVLTIDGQTFALTDATKLIRDGEKWSSSSAASRQCHGSFKQVFRNRFVLVYGTSGDAAENCELLEKARFDSEVWAYRANGDATLVSDAQFLAGDFADRNAIVYGNADTNKAWSAVFDDDCPIQAKRGAITVGGTKHEGVVGAAFVRPRKGSGVALAAAFADTGAAATRLFYEFPVFISGVGIPDYVVFGPGFLKGLDDDVRAAGWFDYAWRMK